MSLTAASKDEQRMRTEEEDEEHKATRRIES